MVSVLAIASAWTCHKANKRFLASNAAELLPFSADDLHARLQKVASRQDGSPDVEPSQSPSESIASVPAFDAAQDLEVASRQALIKAGGRPVCSIQELSDIRAAPMAGYEAVLSWLTNDPDSEDGAADLQTVFTRQFMRWWDFCKSQWDSRGLGDSEAGFSAFLDASRRRYDAVGFKAMVSAPSFNETIRRLWQFMPASRQPPEGQTFSPTVTQSRYASRPTTSPNHCSEEGSTEADCVDQLARVSQLRTEVFRKVDCRCGISGTGILPIHEEAAQGKAAEWKQRCEQFGCFWCSETSTASSGWKRCRHGQGVGGSSS